MRTLTFLAFFVILAFSACKKNTINPGNGESALYGAWSKGSNVGDTIYFMSKNGKHIMRYSLSFNPSMPAYTEREYRFENGQLSVQKFAPTIPDFYPISSFTWTQPNTEFRLNGFEIYTFMSSTLTMFTYKRT